MIAACAGAHGRDVGPGGFRIPVKGNAIEFGLVGEAGGQKVKVSYKGTLEGPSRVAPTV